MNREMKPTIENSRVLSEYLQIKVAKAMKDKYPNAMDIVEGLK